jgi:hypothetical protein
VRVCLFTCRRDAGKARLATRSIPPGWSVAWVVDACDAGLEPPAGVEVLVEPFPRGHNLNGPAACLGIAKVLSREADRFGRVAKMDSDCLLVQTDWLAAGDMAGMRHASVKGAVYGLAYALSRTAAARALEGIQGAISRGVQLRGEDTEITARAKAGGGVLPIGSFGESKHRGKLPPPQAVALHCGSTLYAPREGDAVEKEMLRLGNALGLWRR